LLTSDQTPHSRRTTEAHPNHLSAAAPRRTRQKPAASPSAPSPRADSFTANMRPAQLLAAVVAVSSVTSALSGAWDNVYGLADVKNVLMGRQDDRMSTRKGFLTLR
jgi:hypothetical protein